MQNHAVSILNDQQFDISTADLAVAQSKLNAYAQQEDQQMDTDDLVEELQSLLERLNDQAPTL